MWSVGSLEYHDVDKVTSRIATIDCLDVERIVWRNCQLQYHFPECKAALDSRPDKWWVKKYIGHEIPQMIYTKF